MSKDDSAYKLFERASNIQFSAPREALDILWEAVKLYPNTSTVTNYVLDSIIRIAEINKYWDEAIEACSIAQRLKHDYRKSYELESQACYLDKEGKRIEALEVRLKKETLHGKWYGTYRDFGDQFVNLGANDRAWRLYNEATTLAVKNGISPHTVRQSMANLLISEGKPNAAVEMLIIGISEAEQLNKKGVPKSLITALRKSLKAAGVKDLSFANELAGICEAKGQDQAISIFRESITKP